MRASKKTPHFSGNRSAHWQVAELLDSWIIVPFLTGYLLPWVTLLIALLVYIVYLLFRYKDTRREITIEKIIYPGKVLAHACQRFQIG